MATVYLHIGLPKTGTTAIQNFLWNNRTVLEQHGICYPDFDVHYSQVSFLRNAHFLIAACKAPDENGQIRTGDAYSHILEQLAEAGTRHDRILLADEAIWAAKNGHPAFWEKLKNDLEERGLGLRIIVYLRRQDSFVQSLYRQKIKVQATGMTFDEFFDTFLKSYPVDYDSYLKSLSDILGRENLIIRIYERGQCRGKEHTLFSDFLDIFGLSSDDGFTARPAKLNPPLDGAQLELKRLLNTVSDPQSRSAVLTQSFRDIRLLFTDGENASAAASFFRPGEQDAYLERFAASNSRVAREFLGREDGVLFRSSEGLELPEYSVDRDELLQNAILLYARSVQRLEEHDRETDSLRQELEKLRSELRDVRENVVLYRLKRKLRRLPGNDSSNGNIS